MSICVYFRKGRCNRGNKCKLIHTTKSRQITNNNNKYHYHPHTTMCKYFINGYCKKGKYCKFSHKLSTDDDEDVHLKSDKDIAPDGYRYDKDILSNCFLYCVTGYYSDHITNKGYFIKKFEFYTKDFINVHKHRVCYLADRGTEYNRYKCECDDYSNEIISKLIDFT